MAGLIVVSAPSGTGKSTVCAQLVNRFDDVAVSISYTTRMPRGHERDGVEYHFVDDEVFDSMISSGQFLEWAQVHNRRYGTAWQDVEQLLMNGKDVLFDIDVQGGMKIKQTRPDALLVFILPPSMDELVRRLKSRATETTQQVQSRLAVSLWELEQGRKYDCHILNDKLENAVSQMNFLRTEAGQNGNLCRLDEKLEGLIAQARIRQGISTGNTV